MSRKLVEFFLSQKKRKKSLTANGFPAMARGTNSSHNACKAYRKKYDTTSYGGLQNDIAAASVLAPAGTKGTKS
jgi:hypothetical protein